MKTHQSFDSILIDRLGGNAKVARRFGISSPAVSAWRSLGIPKARMMYLEAVHPGEVAAAKSIFELNKGEQQCE